MQVLNILILGETGVGKSTFINAIANYLKFPSFDAAASNNAAGMQALIPSSFPYIDNDNMILVKIGEESDEESTTPGQSATQEPKLHSFNIENMCVNFIDTPGIGDTREIEADFLNFDKILKYLSNFEELHAVCILLKPTQSKLTPHFQFILQELLCHLHKSLLQNMMFCFTNTRSTLYQPGDT